MYQLLFTYLLTHSLTSLLTHSITHSLTYLLTHLFTYSLTPSLTYSLTHSLIYLLTHSITYLLTHSLTLLLACLLACLLAHSIQQSPPSESNQFSASLEIPRILCNRKVHYRIQNIPPPFPILTHIYPVRALTSHFPQIHKVKIVTK